MKPYRYAVFGFLALVFVPGALITVSLQASSDGSSEDLIRELRERVQELERLLETSSQERDQLTRNLSLGDRGGDVRVLQGVLNRDMDTRVAPAGPGSLGQETEYFGNLTHNAVIRFQEKHAEEILHPLGLRRGTGFVGRSTREKINNLLEGSFPTTEREEEDGDLQGGQTQEREEVSDDVDFDEDTLEGSLENPRDLQALPLGTEGELYLAFQSTYSAETGDTVSVTGGGFSSGDASVRLGDHTANAQVSSDGELSFTVPLSLDPGRYSLAVEVAGERTDNDAFLVVKESGVEDPVITSISPERGLYGQEVRIQGSGFSQEGNEIRASYGILENVPSSSDGTEILFSVRPFEHLPEVEAGMQPGFDSIEIHFYVVNADGVSSEPAIFTLEL